MSGLAWQGNVLTYAFPNSHNDYHYAHEPDKGFGPVSASIRNAAEFILDRSYGSAANDGFSVEGFTNLHISHGSDTGSVIRYAESSYKNPTAMGNFPADNEKGGDVWFGPNYNHYSGARENNYEFATVIHETGHALGLKHGHSLDFGQPKIPEQWDSLEYSVMTYHSYAYEDGTGYHNEVYGYPQTYMMADIAALQHMYGANFQVNSGSTTYSWKPGNANTWVNGHLAIDGTGDNIFATIWDGGGHDTYDLHAYRNNLTIDLQPGTYSIFSHSQLANLGKYDNNGLHLASGNIYNALQYNGDARSLIEDAIGGSGSDVIWGNTTRNRLSGGAGNDILSGFEGSDKLVGGGGSDTFVFKPGWGHDEVKDFGGPDKIDLSSYALYYFDSSFYPTYSVMTYAENHGHNVRLDFGNGNVLTIDGVHTNNLHASDFILA